MVLISGANIKPPAASSVPSVCALFARPVRMACHGRRQVTLAQATCSTVSLISTGCLLDTQLTVLLFLSDTPVR
jgi:hypothetical protein